MVWVFFGLFILMLIGVIAYTVKNRRNSGL